MSEKLLLHVEVLRVTETERRYYHAYENRYRRIYAEGIRYWSEHPPEVKGALDGFSELLKVLSEQPLCSIGRQASAAVNASAAQGGESASAAGRLRVLEPGCGEGRFAVESLARGFDYVGIDLAPSALTRARERVDAFQKDAVGVQLLCRDVTDLSFLEPASFDLAIDIGLLHMLVADCDRRRYLDGLRRALKEGGLVLFIEACIEGAYDGPVETYEDYMRVFAPDLVTDEERIAYNDGREVTIKLDRLPARPRDRKGYARELCDHGFRMLDFRNLETNCGRIIARATITR